MDHSFENHSEKLNKLCRLCGERSFRNQTKKVNSRSSERHYKCETFATDILLYFRVNVNNDKDGTHSNTLCTKCYRRILNFKKLGVSEVTLERATLLVENSKHLWTTFQQSISEDECQSCCLFLQQRKGCIKKKKSTTTKNNDTLAAAATNTHELTVDQEDASLDTDMTVVLQTEQETCKQTNTLPHTVVETISQITETHTTQLENSTETMHQSDMTNQAACTSFVSEITDGLPIRSSELCPRPVTLPPTDVDKYTKQCNFNKVV